MMEVLQSREALTFLACFRTLRDWSKLALGSRTCLELEFTVHSQNRRVEVEVALLLPLVVKVYMTNLNSKLILFTA